MGRSVNDTVVAVLPRPTLQQRPVAGGQLLDLPVRLDGRFRGFEIAESGPIDVAVGNPLRAHPAERDQLHSCNIRAKAVVRGCSLATAAFDPKQSFSTDFRGCCVQFTQRR